MPDFTAAITAGATAETYAEDNVPPWQNPLPDHLPVRWRATASTVAFECTVAGVVAPLDTALAGRLFTAWCVEWPSGPEPHVDGTAGQSSQQTLTLLAGNPGHYVIGIRREGGGAFLIHLDAT